jgi:hypothetical protein
MNWEAVGALSELLGAVAVVASLVYVAAQVRQNTRALQRTASADAIAGVRHWNDALIRDPEVAGIFTRGIEDMGSLGERERAQFITLAVNFFKTYEDMHYQFIQGSMDPEVWAGWERLGGLYVSSPGMQQYWRERRNFFSKSFQAWVDEVVQKPTDIRRISTMSAEGPLAQEPSS